MADYRIELRLTGMNDFARRHTTIYKTVLFTTGNEPRHDDQDRAEAAYTAIQLLLREKRHQWDHSGAKRIKTLVEQLEKGET